MRLDELGLGEGFGQGWEVFRKTPSGQCVTVRQWVGFVRGKYVGSEPPTYSIYVNLHVDSALIYEEMWDCVDALTAQAILFELWARRNRRQKLWAWLCERLGNSSQAGYTKVS